MSKNRLFEEARELQAASPNELLYDEAGLLYEDESEDIVHSMKCWNVRHHTAKMPSMNKGALSSVFAMFSGLDTCRPLIVAATGATEMARRELVAIERSQLEALFSRIAALEEKAGISPAATDSLTPISKGVAAVIEDLAREVFVTGDINLDLIQYDGDACISVVIHVGPDAKPEVMSRNKTELHRRLLSDPATATHNVRIKVVYE